ncbi:MAG: glycosyltransferase [Flavobacteriales bacterium]|nr:glycosyltransferase [Flavobacteriales bacterium]
MLDFNTPIPDAPFDIVLLLNVLHHVGDDFGEPLPNVAAAQRKIIENLNWFAEKTEYLIFQIGFQLDDRLLQTVVRKWDQSGDDRDDHRRDKRLWDVVEIGIAEEIGGQTRYQVVNESNIARNDALGEFRNRPVFILRSLKERGLITPPLVSVICITYRHEKFIGQALEGIVMQRTDFPFEVIVHDDASSDGTADVLRDYERRYPELIKPIYQTVNQHSREKGFVTRTVNAAAKGKYIALCDGDDIWTDPDKLAKQVALWKRTPLLPAPTMPPVSWTMKVRTRASCCGKSCPISSTLKGPWRNYPLSTRPPLFTGWADTPRHYRLGHGNCTVPTWCCSPWWRGKADCARWKA